MLFCLSVTVMVFTFSVAGPSVVRLSTCVSPQPLLVFTFALAKTLFGSSACKCSMSCKIINLYMCFFFLFLSGRNSTRRWPGWTQRSGQLRAEQLRPHGNRRLSGLPELGGSSWGLGRYLSCGFVLHKVVCHFAVFCKCSWVFKWL